MLFILFLATFSLDIFGGGYGFWGFILGLLIHNILVFVIIGVLWISWKYEIVGGIAFILAGLLYISIMIMGALKNQPEWYMLSYSLIIAVPAFSIGTLFLIGWKQKKR